MREQDIQTSTDEDVEVVSGELGAAARRPEYKAPALEKGLRIIELLASRPGSVSMQEITAALGRQRTELYRMLIVLEELGYVERNDDDGRFQLTNRLFELAMGHMPKRSVDEAAKPVMLLLAERTLQSCHLMVNSGDHMTCIARQESPAAVGFAVQVGFRAPMLQSSSGPLYFGFQQRAWRALLLRRLRNTSADRAEIRHFAADANAARERGYMVEPSRLTDGIHDISAPILGLVPGEAVACLTVPFVSHRRFEITLEEAVPMVLRAGAEITRRLRLGMTSKP
jgi:DNA-binding IclR family transcriptional regulator